ncbi:hypothetical protein SNEBB_003207 [Seison nebaliae]|nr:hypothetical protein SNEBB_003207 [Seison nebaliae]
MINQKTKFRILFWKVWIQMRRNWMSTLMELFLPIIIPLIVMLYVRWRITVEMNDEVTEWPSYSLSNSSRALPKYTTLAYTPNESYVHEIVDKLPMRELLTTRVFNTEKEMEDYSVKNSQFWAAAIVFINPTTYKLRFPLKLRSQVEEKYWDTSKLAYRNVHRLRPTSEVASYDTRQYYTFEGFLILQEMIDRLIIANHSKGKNGTTVSYDNIERKMQRLPYPPYIDDRISILLSSQLPFLFTISMMFIVVLNVRALTIEKEIGMRELMKLHGLTRFNQWSVYVIKMILFAFYFTIIMTIVFKIKLTPTESVISESIVRNTNTLILFIFIFLYVASMVTFSLFCAAIFSKGYIGALGGGLLTFFTYMPYTFVQNVDVPKSVRIVLSLFSTSAFSFGTEVLGEWEGRGIGVTSDTLAEQPILIYRLSFMDVLIMLGFDTILYLLLAIYVDDIHPGEYGIAKDWFYPAQYLINKWRESEEFLNEQKSFKLVNFRKSFFERSNNDDLVPTIEIKNLRKVFYENKLCKTSEGKVAVDCLNMKVYGNQITGFLGQNGAGKSTTINMLTGIMKPTGGHVIIENKYDLSENLDTFRNSLGVCQQHNVLFDYMTVKETLYFFATLKDSVDVDREVEKYLHSLNLESQTDKLSRQLSGGQKRRLCIGIAFCGNSKMIILDEPTAGVDPKARREIWEILLDHKKDRTIILTTHFMDEADFLADKIGILFEGKLKCHGTSLFLKGKFGKGYHLICTKNDEAKKDTGNRMLNWFNKDEIDFKEIEIESDIGKEIQFSFPKKKAKENLPQMLESLEKKKNDFNIDNYGLSITTLEEVFLKVTNQHESDHKPDEEVENNLIDRNWIREITEPKYSLLTGSALLIQQFKNNFLKIILQNTRNLKLSIAQVLVPILFVILGVIAFNIFPSALSKHSLLLGPQNYSEHIVPFELELSEAESTQMELDISDVFSKIKKSRKVDDDYTVILHNVNKELNEKKYAVCGNKQSLQNYSGCFGNEISVHDFLMNHVIGLRIEKINSTLQLISLFENYYYHATAYSVNIVSNLLMKMESGNTDNLITTYNHPLPPTNSDVLGHRDDIVETLGIYILLIDVLIAFAFMFASYAANVVNERVSGAKFLQNLSGMNSTIYWLTNFLWNFSNFIVVSIAIIIIFKIGDVSQLTSNFVLGSQLFFLFLLFGPSNIMLMYILSKYFKKSANAVAALCSFNILTGVVPFTVIFILRQTTDNQDVPDALDNIFIILLPNHMFANGIFKLYTLEKTKVICDQYSNLIISDCDKNFFSMEKPGVLLNIIFLVVHAILISGLLVFIESRFSYRIRCYLSSIINRLKTCRSRTEKMENESVEIEDVSPDIIKEQKYVEDIRSNSKKLEDNVVVVDGIEKNYGDFTAVHPTYLRLGYGECFGLLGANGAGKTTIFKMLTGNETPSNGNISINQMNLKSQPKLVQKTMGYCPQFDALSNYMTGKEIIEYYCYIRGIPDEYVLETTKNLMKLLNLEKYANVYATKYSGGNKRKLSTAIALVGNPNVVLLDEPTSGMDVGARRYLWRIILAIRDTNKRSIILTTHSMEECEALCTRASIMMNGQFQCLNSIQQLKSFYGKGYNLSLKTNDGESMKRLLEFLRENYEKENVKIINECQNIAEVQLRNHNNRHSLSSIFELMQNNLDEFSVKDYAITQTTLEQIFNQITSNQISPNGNYVN